MYRESMSLSSLIIAFLFGVFACSITRVSADSSSNGATIPLQSRRHSAFNALPVDLFGPGAQVVQYAPNETHWAKVHLVKLQEIDSEGGVVAEVPEFAHLDLPWLVAGEEHQFDSSYISVKFAARDLRVVPFDFDYYDAFHINFHLDAFMLQSNFTRVFANETISAKPGQLKWEVKVRGWKFRANNNKLRIVALVTAGEKPQHKTTMPPTTTTSPTQTNPAVITTIPTTATTATTATAATTTPSTTTTTPTTTTSSRTLQPTTTSTTTSYSNGSSPTNSTETTTTTTHSPTTAGGNSTTTTSPTAPTAVTTASTTTSTIPPTTTTKFTATTTTAAETVTTTAPSTSPSTHPHRPLQNWGVVNHVPDTVSTVAVVFGNNGANLFLPTTAEADGKNITHIAVKVQPAEGRDFALTVEWEFPAFNHSLIYDPVLATTDLLPASLFTNFTSNSTENHGGGRRGDGKFP